jgi:hypothetical protein
MTNQYYKCSIPYTKASAIPVDKEAKCLIIDVKEGNTLEFDYFSNEDLLNLEWIKIT